MNITTGTSNSDVVILVVVAHSDDEILGAGATLTKFVEQGVNVFLMCMTDGVGSRGENEEEARNRKIASEAVARTLGFEWAFQGNYPDNSLDSIPLLELVQTIEMIKKRINPTTIFTHSPSDLNIDHRIVAGAVLTAWRPIPGEIATEILAMEIPSATDFGHSDFFGTFKPNYFVDSSNTWKSKLLALEMYGKEIYSSPHSRSIKGLEALSILRGHQVGLDRAEAFQIIRKVERN